MNDLAVLVTQDIDFSILESAFGIEITFVIIPVIITATAMWLFNNKAWKEHGWFCVYLQCFSRVSLDIGLVIGIWGSALGIVAATVGVADLDSRFVHAISRALLTMLWGGIFVGVGYFLHNPNIPITAKIAKWGMILSLSVMLLSCGVLMLAAQSIHYTYTEMYLPYLSEAFFPYLIVLGLCLLCFRFNGKPWVVSFTDANLIATMGGLGIGIVLWFTSGAGYEEGRAAIYTCALTLMWGSIFYIFAYVASLYFGTQEHGNYQTKTWHLSEGAVFFIFLLYAPVGATEWQRESRDQVVQEANNQAQELRIEQLEAQLVELRALIKTKETL